MSFGRTLVTLQGVIVGIGFVSNCIVRGERVARSDKQPKLDHIRVLSSDMTPQIDGVFSLFVGNQIFIIHYLAGDWALQ
jgi:hypothetical protein